MFYFDVKHDFPKVSHPNFTIDYRGIQCYRELVNIFLFLSIDLLGSLFYVPKFSEISNNNREKIFHIKLC